MKHVETILGMCVTLTPRRLRADREEQWRADLRDGPGLGISPSSVLSGAARASVTARFHELIYRGGKLLTRFTKGEKLKQTLVMAGAAVVLVAGAFAGIQAKASAETHLIKAPMENRAVGGYEGWWNSTPLTGSTPELSQENVAVNTRTGEVVDAFNRSRNDAGLVTTVSDVNFDVVPDPNWPANSVVIIETSSGEVIEDFLVDEKGSPFDDKGKPIQPQSNS